MELCCCSGMGRGLTQSCRQQWIKSRLAHSNRMGTRWWIYGCNFFGQCSLFLNLELPIFYNQERFTHEHTHSLFPPSLAKQMLWKAWVCSPGCCIQLDLRTSSDSHTVFNSPSCGKKHWQFLGLWYTRHCPDYCMWTGSFKSHSNRENPWRQLLFPSPF